MGEAKSRGPREDRIAAALAREEARRAEWADEMVADAEALILASGRRAKAILPEGATDDAVAALTATLATIAAQRAVATDLLDAVAPQDEDDERDDERSTDPPPVAGKAGFSLVTPPKGG